jgi:lysophospholipase L1-like esterase
MIVPFLIRARSLGIGALAMLTILSACGSTTHRPAAASGPLHRPGSTFLVLGDSLSTGYQPAHLGDPTCTRPAEDATGYGGWACIVWKHLTSVHPGIAIDNLAVNGEDTCSFAVNVHCNILPTGYRTPPGKAVAGSQWSRALAVLHNHPDTVSPITIELGGNDVLLSLGAANLSATRKRLDRIFHSLRQAAPRADIIVFDVYNPVGIGFAPLTKLDAILRTEATTNGALFVDLVPVFAGHTAKYVNSNDVHPTNLGQRVMASTIWKAYKAYTH